MRDEILSQNDPYWLEPVGYQTAQGELRNYLKTGEYSKDSKYGMTNIIKGNWLRFLLLRAGYTELADQGFWWGIDAPMQAAKNKGLFKPKRSDESTNELFLVTADSNNKYGLKRLDFYYPGKLDEILACHPTDYQEGQDLVREKALADFKQAQEINSWLDSIKVPNFSNRPGWDLLELNGPKNRWEFSKQKELILPLHQKRAYMLDKLKYPRELTEQWLYLTVEAAQPQIEKVLKLYGYRQTMPEGGLRSAEKK